MMSVNRAFSRQNLVKNISMAEDCCVLGCKTPIKENNTFCLPKEKDRLIAWSRLIGRPDISTGNVSSYRICGVHFERSMFVDPKSMQSLIPNAIPTLDLPFKLAFSEEPRIKQDPEDIDEIRAPSTDDDFQENEILALENEITKILKSSNTTSYKDVNDVRYKTPNESHSLFKEKFMKWQEKTLKKYKKHQYEQKFRLFCLNLYCNSPKAYKLFEKCFSLPSPISLQNTKLIFSNGINDNLINLQSKLLSKMPADSKYVILCLHELTLTKSVYYDIRQDEIIGYHKMSGGKYLQLSENVLILRIKGCIQDYQQTIGYTLTGTPYEYYPIMEWIKAIIRLLFSSGFEVCAIVASQNEHMEHLATLFEVSFTNPFIRVDSRTIVFIFDIASLMNSIRDNLLQWDFLYGEQKKASWRHVKAFYEKDIERKVRIAPKLTDAHIEPSGLQRTNVQLMKQVFSYTVAAGISAEVEARRLPPEASGTAEFLMHLNSLYDLMDLHKQKNAFGSDSQLQNLVNSSKMFQNLKIFKRNLGKEQNCFLQIVISISSVLRLNEYFDAFGIKSIPTRRLHLNSDELISRFEDFLKEKMLTPIQFRRCFPKLVIQDILKSSKVKCNRLESMVTGERQSPVDFSLLEKYFPGAPKTSLLAIGCTDYKFKVPTHSGVQFVSCYLFNKCLEKHKKCHAFKEYAIRNSTYVHGRVKEVPKDFMEYILKCERWFIMNFDFEKIIENKIGENLLKSIQLIEFESIMQTCPCFPLEFLNKLFLRLRIYNTIKFRNLALKSFRDSYSTYMTT